MAVPLEDTPKRYEAGRLSNPVALIVKASDEKPEIPPAKLAIVQLLNFSFGSKPLALVVLAAIVKRLVAFAPIVKFPVELMRSQSVPAVPMALPTGNPQCHASAKMDFLNHQSHEKHE